MGQLQLSAFRRWTASAELATPLRTVLHDDHPPLNSLTLAAQIS